MRRYAKYVLFISASYNQQSKEDRRLDKELAGDGISLVYGDFKKDILKHDPAHIAGIVYGHDNTNAVLWQQYIHEYGNKLFKEYKDLPNMRYSKHAFHKGGIRSRDKALSVIKEWFKDEDYVYDDVFDADLEQMNFIRLP